MPEPHRYAHAHARSDARVAATSSSSLEEVGRKEATSRWSNEETERNRAAAPPYRYLPLDSAALDAAVAGYVRIVGKPVRRQAQRNYLAATARIHGPRFLEFVGLMFERTGSDTNLLGDLRKHSSEELDRLLGLVAPSEPVGPEPPTPTAPPGGATVVARPASRTTPFDSRSARRYDRPAEVDPPATLFSPEELGPARSATNQALSR